MTAQHNLKIRDIIPTSIEGITNGNCGMENAKFKEPKKLFLAETWRKAIKLRLKETSNAHKWQWGVG